MVGNKNFTDVTKPSEIVQLLLNDEQLASLESSSSSVNLAATQSKSNEESKEAPPVHDLWNDEGDDFFGHTAPAIPNAITPDDEEAVITGGRGKKRKSMGTAPRGRKSAGKKKADLGVETPGA